MNRKIASIAALAVSLSTTAHAGLMGDDVTAVWAYSGSSFHQTSTVLVGPGIELAGNWGGYYSLDVGDDYIDSLLPDAAGILPGLAWHFSSLDYGGIRGVSVSTNFSGWSDSWVTFGDDSVDVNFLDEVEFPIHEGYLNITLLAVPEASSAPLVLIGLAGLIAVSRANRRRTRKWPSREPCALANPL